MVWAQLDREPAMRWMAEQTATGQPPPWLEPAYLIYARTLAKEKPAEAMKWASQIKNAQDREETEIVVARVWRSVDEAAAESGCSNRRSRSRRGRRRGSPSTRRRRW